MNLIRNIIFDMGNVLLAYSPQTYINTIIEDEGAALAVLNELFCGREWQELDAGSISEDFAVECVVRRIPEYAQYVHIAMKDWHTSLKPIEGMSEIIKKLKDKGYKIYLLSNISVRFEKFRNEIEMFKDFDGFVTSAQEKMVKPHKEIYCCLCDRFKLLPEECIFIDDLQVNIDGAKIAGLNTHLFLGAEELYGFFENSGIL
jgi:putative hydrolase of the HAD superfamily